MRIQVMADGASYELTPGYQMGIATWFLESLQVARKFNHLLEPELEAGIRSMFDWCVAITRPDFTHPSVSDAGSLDSKYADSLARPGRIFDNPAAVWVGTEGREGTPARLQFDRPPDSGYFIMRSGWDRNARYLFFEGGPYGRWHQHEDKLSFEVYAHGTPYIVDPGITSYYTNPWTPVLYHNAGAQYRPCGRSATGAGPQSDHRTVDRIRAAIRRSGIRMTIPTSPWQAMTHPTRTWIRRSGTRRAVLFVKPDYFLIFDELTGEGRHTYEAFFHFMPFRLLVDPDTGAVRTGRMNAPNLELLPLVRMTPPVDLRPERTGAGLVGHRRAGRAGARGRI